MKPLEGIRVVDLGRFVSAPFCGMLLADMGAEVIKVEKPGKGEDARSLGPFMNGKSLYVSTFNRNKKGMTIQTRSPEGLELLKELIRKSDVVIENYRPGTIKKMGISYEDLRAINPRIILASISGFGQTGPDALRPAFDPVAQAYGGLYAVSGTQESGPMAAGTVISDLTTGLYTAYAILAAIIERNTTGKGQYIDIAMVDCMVSMMHTYVANYAANGIIPERHGNTDPLSVPADCYRTKDSGYIVMHAGEDKSFVLLKKLIGNPELDDHRFDTHQGRVDCRAEVEALVREWFLTKTAQEAESELTKAGIICSPVNDMAGIFRSEQIRARGDLVEMEVPGAGMCTFQGSPIKMSDAPVTYHRAPTIGENNIEILKNILHKTDEEIHRYKEDGAI